MVGGNFIDMAMKCGLCARRRFRPVCTVYFHTQMVNSCVLVVLVVLLIGTLDIITNLVAESYRSKCVNLKHHNWKGCKEHFTPAGMHE
jgi:hypothetical protein